MQAKSTAETLDDDYAPTASGTVRTLEARHIQMIALGGTIGTGLYLTSGTTLHSAGALGALLAYLVSGVAVFFVVSSLGEMATLIPTTGSFNTYAARFVDPALGFTRFAPFFALIFSGWVYWFGWVTTLPIELLACGLFLSYWAPNVDKFLLMGSVLLLLVLINCFVVKGFGEIEYWLSLMKIIAILFFIVASIYVLVRDKYGFVMYERAGGPFLGVGVGEAIKNTLSACVAATFSFGGTELVGITAGEAKNPRKSIPQAINGTFWRILFFYISCIFLIGMLLPANMPELGDTSGTLGNSPFVLCLKLAKLTGVDHFMNAVCFVAVFSAANSTIYASARSLMALAEEGQAPRFLAKTINGVPIPAVGVSVLFGCIAFAGKFIGDGVVFDWLVAISGLGTIVAWFMICLVHIRFRMAYVAQGYKIEDLPYKSFMYPYGAWFGLIFTMSIIILGPVFAALPKEGRNSLLDFIAAFITIPVYLALYFGYKIVYSTKVLELADVDLRTGNINLDHKIEAGVFEREGLGFEKTFFGKAVALIA